MLKKKKIPFNLSTIDLVFPYFKKNKQLIFCVILLPTIVGLLDGMIGWSLKPYVDELASPSTSNFYKNLIPLLILIIGIIQATLNYQINLSNFKLGLNLSNQLKLSAYENLLQKGLVFFNKTTSGEIETNFNLNINKNCTTLMTNIKTLINQIASCVILLVIIFLNSWILSLTSILLFFPIVFFTTFKHKNLQQLYKEELENNSKISNQYIETFAGHQVIASFNLQKKQKEKLENHLLDNYKNLEKINIKKSKLTLLNYSLISLGVALTIFIAGLLIKANHMTIGNFFSFYTSLLLVIKPFKTLGSCIQNLQENLYGLERIKNLVNSDKEIIQNNLKTLKNVKSIIEYRNIYFEYETNKPILKNINFSIKKGETIAFIGDSGAGKTTLLKLLSRLYDVNRGSILIDGIDIRNYALNSLRDNIAIVFQDNFLFSGTIKDNISLGDTNISDEAILNAINKAYLKDFISSLEKGIYTQIGERGLRLSGGQKQRIGIARVFLKNAPIIIFDEATSSLDSKSELMVQKAISNLKKDRTVLIIAHRISTIIQADKIVVLKNGEITEQGNQKELLEKNSYFKSIYYSQLHLENNKPIIAV